MRRVRFLIWKELIELRSDRRLVGIVVLAPLLELFLLAYAATTDVRNVPIAIVDQDRSAVSRQLIARFEASPSFSIVAAPPAIGDVDPLLERGTAWMALTIPPRFGARVRQGDPQAVQLVADGSDANRATVALGYASALVAAFGREAAAARTPSPVAGRGGIDPRIRVWFNPRLESRDFMVPGVVALLLLVITTNLSSMAIVREKELGTLEQLNVTPLRRWELIAGKLLPYGLVGMIDVVLVLAVALLWFEIPMRGSLALLFALTGVYLLTTLGLGLFVSTISSTQQQAMMTTIFFFLTPMIYLSGFIFPIENMPAVIQPMTYLIPLRYFLVIVRSIFLKGVGLEILWPQALALTAWGVGILALAVARSSKRLG
ncbi:MAG: ABC transporter permease [Acidobacteria bacterium]|nr:ABC transporter permease [Acidobacteriota bacterium]